MGSIWDQPTPDQAPSTAQRDEAPLGSDVPGVADARRARFTGQDAGPLLTSQGRGVHQGVPYGQVRQQEARTVGDMYPFMPGWVSRMRAATRAALGR